MASASFPIAAQIASRVYQPQGLTARSRIGPPTIEFNTAGATTYTVALQSAVVTPVVASWSSTATTSGNALSGVLAQETLHSAQLTDVTGFRVIVTWDTTLTGATLRVHGVSVPVTQLEPS